MAPGQYQVIMLLGLIPVDFLVGLIFRYHLESILFQRRVVIIVGDRPHLQLVPMGV